MYIVRHGESEANVLGLWAGSQSDPALTQKGIEQARHAGKSLIDTEITRIISSPLTRAYHTAKEISNIIGFKKEIEIDNRITAYNWGNITNLTKEERKNLNLRTNPTVENIDSFRERIFDFLFELSKEDHGKILVVTHNGIQKMVEIIKNGEDPANLLEFSTMKNAEVMKYDLSFLRQ